MTDSLSMDINFSTTNSALVWADPASGEAKILRNAGGWDETAFRGKAE